MYRYDEESGRIMSPSGELLTGGTLLRHLNQMYFALEQAMEAMDILVSAFYNDNPEVPDDVDLSEDDGDEE